MQPFLIYLNGVTPSMDSAGNLVFSPSAGSGPIPIPTPTPTPVDPLDDVYFSTSDLVGACAALAVQRRVTTNNNGNIVTVWNGQEPPIQFAVQATGTLVKTSAAPIPVPTPTPTPTPIPVVPGQAINVAWPASGQTRITIGNPDNRIIKLVTQIPANLVPKPNNVGFCRFTEYPGAAFEATQVQIHVNGLQKFDTGQSGDTAPGINWCLGNPLHYQQIGGQFNAQPGDLLEVSMQCYNWAPGQNASRLYDFATPLRY